MDAATQDLLLAQDGDNEAFSRLVVATETDVRRFCKWQCTGNVDLDELVQETFLRAYRSRHTFSSEGTAKTWLLTIARNVCFDYFRSTSRSVKQLHSLRLVSESKCFQFTDALAIENLVDQLPSVFRDAFILVRLMGFRYDEAAEILNCPRGTVQSRVARARQILADEMMIPQMRDIS